MWWPLLNCPSFYRRKIDFGKGGTTSKHTRTHMHTHKPKCVHAHIAMFTQMHTCLSYPGGSQKHQLETEMASFYSSHSECLAARSLGITAQVNKGLNDFVSCYFVPTKQIGE